MEILKEFHKRCGNLVEGEVIDRDYAPITIDERTKDAIASNPTRYMNVRIAHGLFYTDEERKQRIEELRKIKLP